MEEESQSSIDPSSSQASTAPSSALSLKPFTDWLNVSPNTDDNQEDDYQFQLATPKQEGSLALDSSSSMGFTSALPLAAGDGGSYPAFATLQEAARAAVSRQNIALHPTYSPTSALFTTHTPKSLAWLSTPLTPVSYDSSGRHMLDPSPSAPIQPSATPFPLKTPNELTHTPFEQQFPLVSPAIWSMPDSRISPVVRSSQQTHGNSPHEVASPAISAPSASQEGKTTLLRKTFMDKLRTAIPSALSRSASPAIPPRHAKFSNAVPTSSLLSPCKYTDPLFPCISAQHFPSSNTSPALITGSTRSTIAHTPSSLQAPSAESPLTPVPSTPAVVQNKNIPKNRKKRRVTSPGSPTPIPRFKRPRYTIEVTQGTKHSNLSHTSEIDQQPTSAPAYNNDASSPQFPFRTFPRHGPDTVEVSTEFPLFYRRFPVSSFFQLAANSTSTMVFRKPHPGGTYNPPRGPFDLYTPRYVKGVGTTKVGLCPICIESVERGGEDKKLWLSTKFSAFKCYHMQYAHGISPTTTLPFSPPTAFRISARPSATKTEKTCIKEGRCHKCQKWVAVEGIKNVETKVKELFWWKHAATCHRGSTIEGEADVHVDDEVYQRLLEVTK